MSTGQLSDEANSFFYEMQHMKILICIKQCSTN